MGFPFLFAICFAAMIGIAFVNVDKGRDDARRFVDARKLARIRVESQSSNAATSSSGDGGTGL